MFFSQFLLTVTVIPDYVITSSFNLTNIPRQRRKAYPSLRLDPLLCWSFAIRYGAVGRCEIWHGLKNHFRQLSQYDPETFMRQCDEALARSHPTCLKPNCHQPKKFRACGVGSHDPSASGNIYVFHDLSHRMISCIILLASSLQTARKCDDENADSDRFSY